MSRLPRHMEELGTILMLGLVTMPMGVGLFVLVDDAKTLREGVWANCALQDSHTMPECRDMVRTDLEDAVRLCAPLTRMDGSHTGAFQCRVVATAKDPMDRWH